MPDDQAQTPDAKPTLAEELIAEAEKPLTMKDRLVGIVIAIVMFALAAGMFVRPVLLSSADTTDVSGRRTRGLLNIIDLAWSRPVGGILILVGLLVVWGSLTKRSAAKD